MEELPATYVVDGAFGQRWDTGDEGSVGALFGLRYKNDYHLIEEKRQEAQTTRLTRIRASRTTDPTTTTVARCRPSTRRGSSISSGT